MSAAEHLARILAGSVPSRVWSEDTQQWEDTQIDWQTTTEVGGGVDEWLQQRADIVDAELAQERRDRVVTYSAGPIPQSLNETQVISALAAIGVPRDGVTQVVLTRNRVTVTQRVVGDLVDVSIPVMWK